MLVYSDPVAGVYGQPKVYEVGAKVRLPKPLGFWIDTDFMKDHL